VKLYKKGNPIITGAGKTIFETFVQGAGHPEIMKIS
jgi:hypothetical protein